jgi:glucokinase
MKNGPAIMSERLVLGVDIGGTKVAAGIVNEAGEIISKARVAMIVNGTAATAMNCVHAAITTAMKSIPGSVQAIGVASPGPLDPKRGIILNTPNLPCWRDFSLLSEIEQRYGLPTRLDNDANAAGLAEAVWGAGQTFNTLLYVTIGTGIGTAILQERQIYSGRTGAAAEGGHMTIDYHAPIRCGCGKHGCLESMASGPAIALRVHEEILKDKSRGAILQALAGGGPITAEAVCDACDAGDPLAREVIQTTVDLLAVWLGNLIDLLEPDAIVVGGGLGARMVTWLDSIAAGLLRWTINTRANEIPLLPAQYGADVGIAGSAALWLSEPAPVDIEAESKIR